MSAIYSVSKKESPVQDDTALSPGFETEGADVDSFKKSTSPKRISRDEMNLSEFPLAVLSTRTNPDLKTLEFSDQQRLQTGEIIERKWIITGADKFGLPTSTDDDVVLGLMRLSMDRGFRERKVYFTRYELLKALRWSTEGRSYSRLTKSLDRLSGVRIRATNSFFDNSTKAYQTVNFGLIDAYEINDARGNKGYQEGDVPKSFFIWSEKLFESFKSGFIKKLDLDLYFSLKSSVSRRLYRYLDKHFYFRPVVEKNVMTLAFEKLGLSRTYKYVSSIKQQLTPAAEELVQIGFLSDYSFGGDGSQTYVRFVKKTDKPIVSSRANLGETDARGQNAPKLERSESKEADRRLDKFEQIKLLLEERGLKSRQVAKLTEDKNDTTLARMLKIVEYYDSLVSTNDWRISRNKVGFLYKAIENSETFNLPYAYESNPCSLKEQRAKRPELQIIKAPPKKKAAAADVTRNRPSSVGAGVREDSPAGSSSENQEALYRDFLSQELAKVKLTIDPLELANRYAKVNEQLSCLKAFLSQERLRQSVEQCVEEELRQDYKIDDFNTWLKRLV